MSKSCANCKYYKEFDGSCCNEDSEYYENFTDCNDFYCENWEAQPNDR